MSNEGRAIRRHSHPIGIIRVLSARIGHFRVSRSQSNQLCYERRYAIAIEASGQLERGIALDTKSPRD